MSRPASSSPPHDLDAEASVLSALMLDPGRLPEVDRVLSPEDFYAHANRSIARTIWELDADGVSIDSVSIASRLLANGELNQVGGTPYLAQITDAIPAIAHVADHATVVAYAARIRRVQSLCQLCVAEGYGSLARAGEWLQSVEARVLEACQAARIEADTISIVGDAVPEEYDAIVERSKVRALPGRATGIGALDRILGGMIDGVPIVVAGRPGHGKTALAWQIVGAIAKTGALGIFLSQEMPRPQLIRRAIAQGAGIEVRNLQSGRLTDTEWALLVDAMTAVQRLPVAIDDRSRHTPHTMRSSVRRCMQRLRAKGHTGPLGVIAVDYLQIMEGNGRSDTRSTEVAENMRAVTAMAKEFRCPVLVLSQLNREIERRPDKRPKLSDLGESGALEADAYAVIFVYREDVYRKAEDRDGKAQLIVAKNRNGRTGTAELRYLPSTLFAPEHGGETFDEFDDFDQGAHYAAE